MVVPFFLSLRGGRGFFLLELMAWCLLYWGRGGSVNKVRLIDEILMVPFLLQVTSLWLASEILCKFWVRVCTSAPE